MKNFHSKEDGAVIILFAVLLVPFLILTAMSIELARQAYIDTRLAYACDAAAIAAGKYSTANAQANGTLFFNANYLANNPGAPNVTPTFTVSASAPSTVTCTVSGTLPTLLSPIAGIAKLNVSGSTQVQRIVAPSEVALVLDNTGSMSQNNKMAGLITASNQLINTIYQGQASDPNIATAVVPFVSTVNIGTAYTNWLTVPSAAGALPTGLFPSKVPWQGCVMAASTEMGVNMQTDTAPPNRKWPVYYVPTTYPPAVTGIPKSGDNDYTVNANGTITVNTAGSSIGPNRACGLPIQPMTNSASALTTLINKMVPVNGGGTFGDLGMNWGWNVLSPKWAGLWAGGIGPQPYGKTIKSIVFMTDGGNNWAQLQNNPSRTTGEPTAYSTSIGNGTTTGRAMDKTLGSTVNGICTNLNTAAPNTGCRKQIDERMLDQCAKIKAQGIQIFTVGFGQGMDALAASNLKQCASKPEWFFLAGDNASLLTAFTSIGEQLLNISIIK